MNSCDDLTSRLLDGTLTDDEAAELAALVASDPQAEQDYTALLDVEVALRGLRTGLDLADAVVRQVEAEKSERTARAVMDHLSTRPAPPWATRPRKRRLGVAAIALSAAILLAAWVALPSAPDGHTDRLPEVAAGFTKLKDVSGSVELQLAGGEFVPAVAGRVLEPGQTLRTGDESSALLELPDLTQVELEPDTVVRVAAGGGPKLFLASGQLTAAVTSRPKDKPLIVGTSAADVHARNGRFVLASASPHSARVDIREGNVQVVRATEKSLVAVERGRSALVLPGVERVTIEPHLRIDSAPRRVLAFPGARAATFAPDRREIWAANARQIVRWTPDGGTVEVPLPPRKGGDLTAAFTLDRSALVTFRGDKDEPTRVWDLPGCDERIALPVRLPESRFWTASPGPAWVAAAGEPKPFQQRVRVLDGASGAERFTTDLPEAVSVVASSPDGKQLAVGVSDPGRGPHNLIVLLNPVNGDRLFSLPTQRRGIVSLAYSADGRFLAAGFNGLVQLWDVRSRQLVRSISGFERVALCLAFAPDGDRLAAGTPDGQVWVWGSATGRPVQLIDVGSRGLRFVLFAPDGQSIVTVGGTKPVAVWAARPIEAEIQ